MTKLIMLLILGSIPFVLSSCSEDVEHKKACSKLRSAVTKEIRKKHRAELEWIENTSSTHKEICMGYVIKTDSMSIAESREIFVESMEYVLRLINSDSGIRPYLCKYPVTVNDIKLTFGFKDARGFSLKEPDIDMVSIFGGKVDYSTEFPPINKCKIMKTVHSETYEEALKIIRESENSL